MTKLIQRTATVTLPNGEKKRLKAYGETEREAILKLAKLKAEWEAGLIAISTKTTFARWQKEYFEVYKAPTVTAKSLENDQRKINKYFLPLLHDLPLENVTPAHIQRCLNNLEGMSDDYIKKSYYLINNIMHTARISRLIRENPVEYVNIPRGREKQSRRALTEAERTLFLAACKKAPHALIFLTTFYCGLRPGEARALQWQNLDLKAATLKVQHTVETGSEQLTKPKSKAGYRSIPIPDKLLSELKKLPRPLDPNTFVFTGTTQHCTKQRYERGWRRLVREMNIAGGAQIYRNQIVEPVVDEKLSPYYLRHTYCTMLAENNIDLKTAQYLMGHSDIKMTADIYTHVTSKMLDNCMSTIKAL